MVSGVWAGSADGYAQEAEDAHAPPHLSLEADHTP